MSIIYDKIYNNIDIDSVYINLARSRQNNFILEFSENITYDDSEDQNDQKDNGKTLLKILLIHLIKRSSTCPNNHLTSNQ